MWKCENVKLTRSHIHTFSPMLVFCHSIVVYGAMPKVIKGIAVLIVIMYADLFCDLKMRCSLASLARAYKLQFFLSVHLGVLPPPPPPPNTKKLATLLEI